MIDERDLQSDSPELTANTSLSLLERAKRNEVAAWQVLVELYAPVIYSRCRRHWKLSAQEAEDVGQEVLTAVARKLKDFQRQRTGSFRKWLRTITDNKCKDLFARDSLAAATGGSTARRSIENVRDRALEDVGEATNTETSIVMRQALKAVETEFSDRDVKIFWSIAVDERSRQEIATEWEIPVNVVYLAYSRIRNRLSEVFQELLEDYLEFGTV